MLAVALAVVAASAASGAKDQGDSAQAVLQEESPDVFLAKATLQQYLSRIVRKDWDGVKRLTHPKALSATESQKRTGLASNGLAPWANPDDQLKTFEFRAAKRIAPGVVLVGAGEDVYHREAQGMSIAEPAVYILFKTHGAWLVGDKRADAQVSEISEDSVRIGRAGWVDHEAQARRAERMAGKHR